MAGLVNNMLGRFSKIFVALVAVLFASTASFAGVVVKDNEVKRSIPKGQEIVLDKVKVMILYPVYMQKIPSFLPRESWRMNTV